MLGEGLTTNISGYFLEAAGLSELGRIRRFYWKIDRPSQFHFREKTGQEIPGDNKRGATVL